MKNYNETLARLFELDERRTQGEWMYYMPKAAEHNEQFFVCENGKGGSHADVFGRGNAAFIAAAPTMMQVIRHQQEVIERLTKQRDMAVEIIEEGLHYTMLSESCQDESDFIPRAQQFLAAIEADGKE